MALISCPECHEQMSDLATACPHCGFPNIPQPTTAILNEQEIDSVLGALRSAGMSSDKIADSIREQLHQAGIFGSIRTTVSINGQTVSDNQQSTTRSPRSTSATSPIPTFNVTSYGYGYRSGFDYRSKWTLLGLPLLAMSQGYDPATGRKRVAKGWIAVGDLAVGGLAIGGGALGGIAVGGGSVGLISIGGVSIGILAAFGGAAISSGVAVGGLAVGLYSMGGLALGPHANWFMQHV